MLWPYAWVSWQDATPTSMAQIMACRLWELGAFLAAIHPCIHPERRLPYECYTTVCHH